LLIVFTGITEVAAQTADALLAEPVQLDERVVPTVGVCGARGGADGRVGDARVLIVPTGGQARQLGEAVFLAGAPECEVARVAAARAGVQTDVSDARDRWTVQISIAPHAAFPVSLVGDVGAISIAFLPLRTFRRLVAVPAVERTKADASAISVVR
jgi:hypothetical protein